MAFPNTYLVIMSASVTYANRLIETFQDINDVVYIDINKSIFRRFANSFSKRYAVESSDNLTRQGSKKDRYISLKGKVKVLLMIPLCSVLLKVLVVTL